MDISKNVRDMMHLEIKISALCDPMCKGLCLKCGHNLNILVAVIVVNRARSQKVMGLLEVWKRRCNYRPKVGLVLIYICWYFDINTEPFS